MICAWVVTSSAVVASSAMSSLGRQASAMAIMTRWRMPPESWCGYSAQRCSGSGMCTRRSSSTACSRACFLVTARCARTASAIWAPIRIVGFSDRVGSWNTMATLVPRCWRSCSSVSPISSVPANLAEPVTAAASGSRPMTARQLTVLPDPDSPTMASVWPA
jgi:hypothetical protein